MSLEQADAEKKAEPSRAGRGEMDWRKASPEGAERRSAKHQMLELDLWGSGQNPRGHRTKSASKAAVATGTKSAAGEATMEAVVARENILRALRAVERNAGVTGVDGMTTEELRGHLCARDGTGQPR